LKALNFSTVFLDEDGVSVYDEKKGGISMNEIVTMKDFYGIWLVHVKGEIDPASWRTMPHSHEHHELFVHVSGEMDIYAEDHIYHLSGGEIRFYSAGELHGGLLKSRSAEWFQICLPPTFMNFSDAKLLTTLFTERSFGEGNVFVSKRHEEIVRLLGELFEYYKKEHPLCEVMGKAMLVRVLGLLCDPSERIERERHHIHVLNRLIETVNAHFATIETVSDLCEMTHYSMSYVSRLFRENLDISPYQFILGKKLNEAKNALKAGKTVMEAAEMAGFRNYSNFITLFHKRFGVTPHKYK
jgi:AraC-like DNA-binding protein